MPVINRIADYAQDMKGWRRHLHQHPELGFDCHETAAFVVARLREFGVDAIHEGIGRTGVVAIIEGQGDGPVIGLRADMDALPMTEATGAAHASKVPGRMHACGHDGHTAMLLGAARYLAETRRFSGRVALIFQPAEEDGGGGQAMVNDGLIERFGISQVYALHNSPSLPVGHFLTKPGAIMAADDTVRVYLTGKGGHAAYPHSCVDSVPAIVGMVSALQTIASRTVDPLLEVVLSITEIHIGSASNVIAETGWFGGTVRTFSPEVRTLAEKRVGEIVQGLALAHGVTARVEYERGYPATINHPRETAFAAGIAREISGDAAVNDAGGREMGVEDFSYILEKCPGSYLFLGQGIGPDVHHPAYDFNDEVAPVGASFFARLVEKAQPLR
ncbi:MAG: amidohydrolase [Rhodobacteraceae bacterium]|nr:amidohydrolase [Paracoccaceae bacterium]